LGVCVHFASCIKILNERALGAILGSFVSDAATMPLHWIYDVDKIKNLVGTGNPEFYKTPSCPYYTYPLGENTPYGQQTLIYLSALAAKDGIDPTYLQNKYYAYYTAGGPCYTTAANKSLCYHDASTKEFVTNVAKGKVWPKCGGNDDQANAIAHMPLVVARYAGDEIMLDHVATLIRITQNTGNAVAFGMAGARILEKIIMGSTGIDAVKLTSKELKDPSRKHPMPEDAKLATGLDHVLTELGKSNFDVVQEVGQSCDYPFNLWSGAHLIAQEPDFINATRQRIMSGGDSGSANLFNGAIFGAIAGEKSIPAEWKQKTMHYQEILVAAKALLSNSMAR